MMFILIFYRTLLHYLSYENNPDLVKYLITNSFCEVSLDSDGNSPLHLAVKAKNYEIVSTYCELFGREIIEEKGENNSDAIELAQQNNDSKMVSLLESFLNDEQDGNMQLFDAASNGDLEAVKKFIENGDDINQISKQGYTPLGCAIYHDKVDVVKYLLGKRARTSIGSAIKIAVNRKNKQICDLIIKMTENINEFDENGLTFLDYTVADQFNPDLFISLIRRGAKLDQRNKHDQMSPFDILVEDRNIEAIDALCANKIPLDVPSRYSFTHAAASLKDTSFLTHIINSGGNVNFEFAGKLPLQAALHSILTSQDEKSAFEDIKLLLNPTSFEDLFGPALALLEYGADPKKCFMQAIKEKDQIAVFFYLIAGCHSTIFTQSSILINQLLKFFSPSNSIDSLARFFLKDNKLLILAARFSPPETLTQLIRKGYDIDAPDSNGMRPIHHAISACKFANVNVLIEYCAAIQSPNFSIPSLLHCVASNESMMYCKCPSKQFSYTLVDNFVKYLLQNGENIDISSIEGNTPLSLAIDHKNYRFAEVLLRNGAKNDWRLTVKYISNLIDEFPPESSNTFSDSDLIIGKSKLLTMMSPNNTFLATTYHPSSLLRLASLYFGINIDLNAIIDQTTKQTMLHIACKRHLLSFIRFLVLNGADVNATDKNGTSAIGQAIIDGQADVVEQLITQKLNLNLKDSKGISFFFF
ncbi:hypothetical protein TRFO_13263 [Tritrichomonas foetus]|uniref:Uncharacterized protein n=1 Tax=Tritrichomonas foetus TaxID=1144522 RepID=A0A1J4KYC1_9EUKA|nr:hypothetical protein TRFO_13263 [Tritrichomonas foetus]|eukprot:OHT16259.1 hypothetical protein TRFO_13263 [Tritrichomonas foetus]